MNQSRIGECYICHRVHDLNHFCPPFERLEGGKSEEYQMEQARKDQEERNDNKESKETVKKSV